jgi:hypothetical protein
VEEDRQSGAGDKFDEFRHVMNFFMHSNAPMSPALAAETKRPGGLISGEISATRLSS